MNIGFMSATVIVGAAACAGSLGAEDVADLGAIQPGNSKKAVTINSTDDFVISFCVNSLS